jgi:hypothetical protein
MRLVFFAAFAAVICQQGLAIDNIPIGQNLWLQGFTGVVPTPGFEVDGTLRMESIDEPVDIGLQVLVGEVTNSPSGTILIGTGAGGGRFFFGDLLNQGSFQANDRVDFPGDGSIVENHGSVQMGANNGVVMYGKNCLFDQEEGSILVPANQSSYLLLQYGEFHFNGGSVTGEVWVANGAARVSDSVESAVNLRFFNSGCVYDGNLSAGRRITVDMSFGPVDVTLTNAAVLDGQIAFHATSAGSPATLQLAQGGLVVTTNGAITLDPLPGEALIRGNLAMYGSVTNFAALRLQSPMPVTNGGNWMISGTARLDSDAAFVNSGGVLTLGGGLMNASSGLWNQAGTIDASAGGVLSGEVTNDAIAKIDQLNPLNLTGDWLETASGQIQAMVDGDDTTVAALQVDGKLKLDGRLALSLGSSTSLTNGQIITVASATSVSGYFSAVQYPVLTGGLRWGALAPDTNVQFVVTSGPGVISFLSPAKSPTNTLAIVGSVGANLVIEESADLAHWAIFTNLPTFSGYYATPMPTPNAPRQFFRASVEPPPAQ